MLGVLLDSGPLGVLCNPHETPQTRACYSWARDLVKLGGTVTVPEIADYEVRRELLRAGLSASILRLNEIHAEFEFLPIRPGLMLRAAQLWADARNVGIPTADRHALDGDVILAAQANILSDAGIDVVVATDNPGHLSRFAPAARWQDIHLAP